MIELDPDRHPLEMLAEEFAERCRQGECPSVSEYVERYPHLADSIRELFPSIGLIERLGRNEHDSRERLERRHKFRAEKLNSIGEYEIVRELGRGGMGVVFEARQASLGRRVALKVLPSGVLSSPRQLTRFRREATAAARLHHTNIVPVFGVGEHEDLHYYAMQFIDGVALDKVLSELRRREESPAAAFDSEAPVAQNDAASAAAMSLCNGDLASAQDMSHSALVPENSPPTMERVSTSKVRSAAYWKAVAQIGAQVAAALDYAHSRGVLHRDIKPANLLLDRQGIVWVADFGLAKLAEHDELTRSGDIVGTLRYMAPEQFDGDGDSRSDIFSLGMTLYELVTLQPARSANSTQHALRQLADAELPAPRSIDSTIPRDLETIVLKAATVDPARRYRTAGELSEDLERFLTDRPILARRISTAERLWRWARRNPLSATLAAAVIALTMVVLVVTIVSNVETKAALHKAELSRRQAETQRQQAEDEHARAEANLALALEAFEDISGSVAARGNTEPDVAASGEATAGEDASNADVAVTAADAELLEGMVKFFADFAERNDADLRDETAQAHRRVGDIRARLGQYEEAETAYRAALADYETAIEDGADEEEHVIERVEILNELGLVLAKLEEPDEARSCHQEAYGLLLDQSAEFLATPQARAALSATLSHLAGDTSTEREVLESLMDVPTLTQPKREAP